MVNPARAKSCVSRDRKNFREVVVLNFIGAEFLVAELDAR
jgi:hypothetical protein